MDFTKENTKFNSFYDFQLLIWGGKLRLQDLWMKYGKNFDSEIIFIRPRYCSLYYFEPRYISLGLKPLLLTQFSMYQMYLSSQSSSIVVILNQLISQQAVNPYQQLISKKAKTTLPFVTIKAFSFLISSISLWFILLSFNLTLD